jgi:nucleoside-diphosphate-sugar epimerase
VARKKIILITGAGGEVGHGLIEHLHTQSDPRSVVAMDIQKLDEVIATKVDDSRTGNILDETLLQELHEQYEIDAVFHLAALLSTTAEFKPELAHRVNVQGTINLLNLAIEQGQRRGAPVKFIFPSSLAIYGIQDLKTKRALPALLEQSYLTPITMYGCNKLYCENVGRYYAHHYCQLADTPGVGVDFRCLRYPGLISAVTTPSGGTSDYGPEMLHAAAKGEPYVAFVRPDTTIPFMAMPDAIKSILMLEATPRASLSQLVYNVTSFGLSAEEFAELVKASFPDAEITYRPSAGRQKIVDSWPAEIDDSAARRDWGWFPDYDADRAFNEYLVPTIKKRYE